MNLGRENEVLEFKETTRELTEAIIDIVAILNKHNRGTLYFGVKNNGDVLGFQIGDSTERDISRKIFERIKPQIFPEIETDINNKIVKVSFQGVERPYSADGRYYIRVSDESREMSPQELTRMIMEVNYKSWEKQITDNSINDVDEINLKKFLDSAIKSKRLPYMEYNKIELLNKLNLLSEDKKWLNNAGRYLFSNKKPIQLKMAVFATNEKRSFIDISTSDGNIFELVEDAEKYIKKNINWKVTINDISEREEVPEIPIKALREIINNSFAHANYLGYSKNEIDIFPNRVAIYNPGAFPDNLNPEDYVNKTLSSKIRNEIIADVLYKCHFIESWGTGFKNTYEICKENSIECTYEKEQDGFWFIFYRKNVTTNDTIFVTTNDTIKLTELELLILNEIKEDNSITREKLSQKIGRSSRNIQRILDNLKQKGIVYRVGPNKGGHWEIRENNIL